MTDGEIEEKAKEVYRRCFDDDYTYPDVLNAIRIGIEETAREICGKNKAWHYLRDYTKGKK